MSASCCVCRDGKETPENRLFTCQSHGCDVTVHQGCYGIVTVPSGLWFCRKCESQERAARVRCELCPRKEGALKRTDSGGWAHVVCALYIPEVTFGNNRRMEPIVTTKLPKERFSKSCYVCEEQGLETQATYGACMSCHKSSCRLAFHVTCAQKEHLLCEEEDQRDPRNIIYCGYCSTHYKKMIKQKFKSKLRKEVIATPTPSSAPPPFPPLTAQDATPPSFIASPTSTAHPSTFPALTHSQDVDMRSIGQESSPIPHTTASMKGPSSSGVKHAKQKDKPSSSSSSSLSATTTLHPKRHSSDQPLPPAKRKKRPRKFSSSNESSTSEAPSNTSDLQPQTSTSLGVINALPNLIGSPLSTVAGLGGVGHHGGVGKGHGKHEPPVVDSIDGGRGTEMILGGGVAPYLPTGPLEAPPTSVSTRLAVESSTGASDQSNNTRTQPLAPPRSLQELLERQWEQTAKFILDQAGKQNNAGSMLAHLHTLQSENRGMQSRIMELASKREFYIAINTKLRQTLTEHEALRIPNGVQQPSHGGGAGGGGVNSITANTIPLSSNSRADRERSRGTMSSGTDDDRTVVLSSTIPKEAQDSLLQAHFSPSSLQQTGSTSLTARNLSSSAIDNPSSHPHSLPPSHSHNSHLAQLHDHDRETLSMYDVTHVTNSVQAPITAYTPLPNDTSVLVMGRDGHHGNSRHGDDHHRDVNVLYADNFSSSTS